MKLAPRKRQRIFPSSYRDEVVVIAFHERSTMIHSGHVQTPFKETLLAAVTPISPQYSPTRAESPGDDNSNTGSNTVIQNILNLAIKKNAPVNVIRSILRLDANAAAVPKNGPSALQLALRHEVSMDIIKELIEACPEALSSGNGSYDPLTYAKIWRPEDHDLIELLEMSMYAFELQDGRGINKLRENHVSTPVPGYEEKATHRTRNHPDISSLKEKARDMMIPRSPLSLTEEDRIKPRSSPSKSSSRDSRSSNLGSSALLGSDEKSEFSSLKLLTSSLIRSHKRHKAELVRLRESISEDLHTLKVTEAEARMETNELNKALIASLEKNMGQFCKLVADAIAGVLDRQEQLQKRVEQGENEMMSILLQAFRHEGETRMDHPSACHSTAPRSTLSRSIASFFTCHPPQSAPMVDKDRLHTDIKPMKDAVEVCIKNEYQKEELQWSPYADDTSRYTDSSSSTSKIDFSPYYYPNADEVEILGKCHEYIPLVERENHVPMRRRRWPFCKLLMGRNGNMKHLLKDVRNRKKKRSTSYPYFRGNKMG